MKWIKYLKLLMCCALLYLSGAVQAQVTTLAPGGYKNIILPFYNGNNDYTRNLILLHECYDGTPLAANFTIGTITALRGGIAGWNRLNVAQINSSTAYDNTSANVVSNFNNTGNWKLKTCRFNGKKYLALEVPYNASYHDQGYKFTGWSISTGSEMLAISYEIGGQPYNQAVLSDIQDFVPNVSEHHDVASFLISGNVGIGTTNPTEKLSVNGNIRAREVKVTTENWPDYVFDEAYQKHSLPELEQFIKANKHLPEMPSAKEAEANGIALGQMNKLLLKKIEELTLHLIQKGKEIDKLKLLDERVRDLEKRMIDQK